MRKPPFAIRRRALAAAVGAIAIGSAAGVFSQALAQDDRLVVSSWGGSLQATQRKVFFEPFQKEANIRLVEDEWGGEVAKLRAMVRSGTPTWDVVEVSPAQLEIGCGEGLLEPIDFARVGGKERFLEPAVHECGVGTNASSLVIGYDPAKFSKTPTSVRDFFDVANFPGPRALRKSPRLLLEMALLGDGVAPKDVYPVLGTEEGVARAFKKLDAIKPHVKVWITQWSEATQLLVSGEVNMSAVPNGRLAATIKQDKKDLRMIWDGQALGYDYWAIVKGTKRQDLAYKFINFASQDAPQVEFTHYVTYGPTLKSAVAKVPPEIAAQLPTAPDNMKGAYLQSGTFWADHSDDYTTRFNAWLDK